MDPIQHNVGLDGQCWFSAGFILAKSRTQCQRDSLRMPSTVIKYTFFNKGKKKNNLINALQRNITKNLFGKINAQYFALIFILQNKITKLPAKEKLRKYQLFVCKTECERSIFQVQEKWIKMHRSLLLECYLQQLYYLLLLLTFAFN